MCRKNLRKCFDERAQHQKLLEDVKILQGVCPVSQSVLLSHFPPAYISTHIIVSFMGFNIQTPRIWIFFIKFGVTNFVNFI